MRTATALLSRPHDLHVRALHKTERAVDVTMSTDAEDRHGEIVEQRWRLDRYRTNNVVLWGHDSRSPPIGRAENVRVEGGALRGTIVFASEKANPEAERVWNLVREGMVNACSVGFIPHDIRVEKRDGREVVVLSDNELLELSVVTIPANDEALMQRSKAARAGRAPSEVDAFKLAAKRVEEEESSDDA